MNTTKLELILHNKFYPQSETRDFIARVCGQLGFRGEDIYFIKAALDEVCSNIVRHSYRDRSGFIKIQIDDDGERFTLSIKDCGKPFLPRAARRSSPGEIIKAQKEGGLGLSLIERLMDEVQYIRRKKYNELRMVKFHERNGRT
jgi:serine/threonine-protein kinase RsbW